MVENLAADYLVCEYITKKASSTFYLGSSMFPQVQQKYVWAIYAFCRHADDLVDESNLTSGEIEKRLGILMSLIENIRDENWKGVLYSDEIKSIAAALKDTFQQNVSLTKEPFVRLIEGVSLDLYKKSFASAAELTEYCDKVAGGVGQIICELLGIKDQQSILNARKMGNAMQMTNILRDIGEDQRRGRIYLPAEKLHEYQIKLPLSEGMQLRKLISDLVAVTRLEYQASRKSLKIFPLRIRIALNAASYLYEGILDDIQGHDYSVLNRRAHVHGIKKVVLAGKSLLASLF